MKMRDVWIAVVLLAAMSAFVAAAFAQDQSKGNRARRMREPPPYWAYAVDPESAASDASPKPADDARRHVPDSSLEFTLAQTQDLFTPPDWHPAEHPGMPTIVAHGRKPSIFACGYCHLPNGQGRPENSSLAGMPAGYIVEQMADFKSGLRKSSEPRQRPIAMMIANETQAKKDEIEAAAEYFSRLKPRPWIRVIETTTVPKTHVAGWMLIPDGTGAREPVGDRIIETAANLERVELRDDTSGFIAYVPAGSVDKGKTLVKTGGTAKTVQCAICHGADLKGKGNVPSIAGRSPSYIVRQLYDIQSGARAGAATQLMKATVANLTLNDMISIAAYTASLRP